MIDMGRLGLRIGAGKIGQHSLKFGADILGQFAIRV